VSIKQACLSCHGNPVGTDEPYGHKMEGYEPGEIRGGISVALPLK
jgi:methyl-accepting chemotaxis protein